jgi:hypothetical protein
VRRWLVGACSAFVRRPDPGRSAGGASGDARLIGIRAREATRLIAADAEGVYVWQRAAPPTLGLIGEGVPIEVHYEASRAAHFTRRFPVGRIAGCRAPAHTRMPTSSCVRAGQSHALSTRRYLCRVHEDSLSDRNRPRPTLEGEGIYFKTVSRSDVGVECSSWWICGDTTLKRALLGSVTDAHGCRIFVIGPTDGFAALGGRRALVNVSREATRWR